MVCTVWGVQEILLNLEDPDRYDWPPRAAA
jgi:hypothetical protein